MDIGRSTIRFLQVITISLFVAAIAWPGWAVGSCPVNCVAVPDHLFCSEGATWDTTMSPSGGECCDSVYVHCDLHTGEMATRNCQLSLDHCVLTVTDDFIVTGLPSGTPVSLAALFAVSFRATKQDSPVTGGFVAKLSDAASHSDVVACLSHCAPSYVDTARIQVQTVAGEPFRLVFILDSQIDVDVWSPINAEGRILFESLPEGASISSCQGFGGVVPALPTTWGRLKSNYR